MSKDKTLVCKDCGSDFVFTASEQDFYAEKGFTNEPVRCPKCRAERKSQVRSNKRGSGGGGGFNKRPARKMYTTTCSSCGKPASVPFQPSSGKPVYCSDCFESHKR